MLPEGTLYVAVVVPCLLLYLGSELAGGMGDAPSTTKITESQSRKWRFSREGDLPVFRHRPRQRTGCIGRVSISKVHCRVRKWAVSEVKGDHNRNEAHDHT